MIEMSKARLEQANAEWERDPDAREIVPRKSTTGLGRPLRRPIVKGHPFKFWHKIMSGLALLLLCPLLHRHDV